MRLKHIKLAGFKSFVDPTILPFPSNLVGIVGPNGCGKSNVVDAIRWVMGESSAKQLRGESMDDVIFNGSSARKPVSQAFVELHFDNQDGTIGGEYASYSNIAIKRLVTRDGQSNYFLNGSKCRRKDIIDVFLGTGLGPRSYSVIEQGMISRFVEAKPEDMRVFLEEAAGVSKYKERRRETETRLRHTRENLDRLQDLREEVSKQLDKLRQQAKAAERYKLLKQEERTLKAQLLVLHWQEMDNQLKSHTGIIQDSQVKIEQQVAEQHRIGAELEHTRQQQIEFTDEFNQVQSRYYALGTDIARLEESINHHQQRIQQLQADQVQTEQAWQALKQHLSTDQQRIDQCQQDLEQTEPELTIAVASESTSREILESAEQNMSDWQQQWDDINQQANQSLQSAERDQARIQNLEEKIRQAQQRQQRFLQELQQVNVDKLPPQIAELSEQQQSLQMQVEAQQQLLQQLRDQITEQRQINEQVQQQGDQLRADLQIARARQKSLLALQQAATGSGEGSVSQWLSNKQLTNNARLAKQLQIDSGWETAVETVLGAYLEAICVEDFSTSMDDLQTIAQGELTLFDTSVGTAQPSPVNGDCLQNHVQASCQLGHLLQGVYCVDDLPAALHLRQRLQQHESVVTKAGIWLGRNWMRVNRSMDKETSIVARERELSQLLSQIQRDEPQLQALTERLQQGRQQLQDTEQQRDDLQRQLNDVRDQSRQANSQLQIKQNALERLQQRLQELQSEIDEQEVIIEQSQQTMLQTRDSWQQALQAMEQDEQRKQNVAMQRTQLRDTLEQARSKAHADKERVHQLSMRVENAKTQLHSAQESIARMQQQRQDLSERREQLQQRLQQGDNPIVNLQQELDGLLQQRLNEEVALNTSRQRLETVNAYFTELEKQRETVIEKVENLRAELQQHELNVQTYQVRRSTYLEQLQALNYHLETVQENLPADANLAQWQVQLEKMATRIQRLGAINLAAIDECSVQEERKQYLDAQYADLIEAVETLESAIRKIDRETKEKLHDTFDIVNARFKELFPRVFGGGSAYLELTGDDLLSAGIAVMARPPGKRNSSIHLLSGGEKALTAISLVFAIFELNPAPFCLLDEVDAPLDDSNVNRFCHLVREMSETVQFIFISHNKVAIEMANHLAGVTMHEAGVSRVVAVDVDEAVEMAVA